VILLVRSSEGNSHDHHARTRSESVAERRRPIQGWFPDGTGGLKDSDIDRIMFKRIQQTRTEWDK
jgi:hypothetical protein